MTAMVKKAIVPDPRHPVFNRKDLIYGSQFYHSAPVLPGQQPAYDNAQALRLRAIRYQDAAIPTTLGGKLPPPTFHAGIDAIHSLGAVPLIGIPPIGVHNTASGSDPWSYRWQRWVVVDAAACGAVLFEMGNEPNNPTYQDYTAAEYFDNLWVNVPRLKAHARKLGHTIYLGGPATTGFCSKGGNITWVRQWLSMCQARYEDTGNRDWIPDYVSVHCYGGAPASNAGSIPQAMSHLSANFDTLRKLLNSMDGPVAGFTGRIIKLVNSEYDIGIKATIGDTWQNQAVMDDYFSAIFAMAHAASPVDGQQRVWMMNQFCVIGSSAGGDLLNPDGTPRPAYHVFKAHSA
jgi:Glycosyl hydrolase catalytic core